MGKANALVDSVALVVYAIAANPVVTGLALHEWLGLGIWVVIVVHCAFHVDQITATAKGWANIQPARKFNLVVDALMVVALIVCVVSGLLISGTVLRAFGLYADGYYLWNPMHAASAKVLLALILVHLVGHFRQIADLFKQVRERKAHE